MKITFVCADYEETPPAAIEEGDWTGLFHFGIAQLSACLKSQGHDTSLIQIVNKMDRDEFIASVKSHDPHLLAFTSMSGVFSYICKIAGWAKEETGIKTICGGAHPTLDTEETVLADGIDMACRGEGEIALVELCERLEEGKDYMDIANIWVKRNGEIHRNRTRHLIDDLDSLPDFDREIFDFNNLYMMRKHGIAYMLGSRGCPFDCTYCCNHFIKKTYPNTDNYLRFRSPQRIIKELKAVQKRYPSIKLFRFWDNVLTIKKPWAKSFLELYQDEIDIPFHCYDKIGVLSEERVEWLQEAGCKEITLGIQSGNEEVRAEILNRKMSNQKILEAASWLNNAGIRIQTDNIIGFPSEDKSRILDTIKINARIDPAMIKIYYFNPFKHTRLYELCREKGYLRDDKPFAKNLFDGPNLKLPTITDEETRFCNNHFIIMMILYKICFRRLRWAVPFMDATFSTRFLPHYLLNLVFRRFLSRLLRQNFSLFELPKAVKLFFLFTIIPYGIFITFARKGRDYLKNTG